MKDLHCRDVGATYNTLSGYWNCEFVARGSSNEQILEEHAKHAREAHSMTLTPRAASLIHDESSKAHGQAIRR